MRSRRFLFNAAFLAFLSSASILLHGCGGGGSKTTEPEKFYPLSTQTRALQPGDNWTYDNGDGVTIASAPLDGATSLTQIFRYAASDGNFGYSVKYFSQNNTQEVTYLGQRGPNSSVQLPDDPTREGYKLPEPQTVLFGNWTQGATLSFKLLYNNYGEVYPSYGEFATLTIVGTEKVKTPLGTFDTWKVESKPDGMTQSFQITGTYWYAPQLGTYVRSHEVISSADPEIGGEYDKTLKFTNVPLRTPQAAP